ncbi:MAG TPA: hypothetical protein VNO70_17140 [Blastocatellia bacterium]|nr:hypothetical protein [Blastocatellia bacterium]
MEHSTQPRTTIWRERDYQEIVLYVEALKFGYVWRVMEGTELIERQVGLLDHNPPEALIEEMAVKDGLTWLRRNKPNARIRVRSNLERRLLFGEKLIKGRLAA